MNFLKSIVTAISLFAAAAFAAEDTLDAQLSALAKTLAAEMKESGRKKATVLDFADLQGNTSEFGRFVSERLTGELVSFRKDFNMVDRANLKRILDEHKLTQAGLVDDPEASKKLGQISGVDALIIGSITPFGKNVEISARILATDSALIVGAAKARIPRSEDIDQILGRDLKSAETTSQRSKEQKSDARSVKDFSAKNAFQTFDNFAVELDSFRTLRDGALLFALVVKNLGTNEDLLIGLNTRSDGKIGGATIDGQGNEFWTGREENVTGLSVGDGWSLQQFKSGDSQGEYRKRILNSLTTLPAGKSIKMTLKQLPSGRGNEFTEPFKFQCEFIVAIKKNNRDERFLEHNVFVEDLRLAPESPSK